MLEMRWEWVPAAFEGALWTVAASVTPGVGSELGELEVANTVRDYVEAVGNGQANRSDKAERDA